VHSRNRVNRRVHLERLGQRRCACVSNPVVAQSEGAFSDSGIEGVESGEQEDSTLCAIKNTIARKTVCRSSDEISRDCALT
jgi:hypothetical protein